jgi:hypothetical protein
MGWFDGIRKALGGGSERDRRIAVCRRAAASVWEPISQGGPPDTAALVGLREEFGLSQDEALAVLRACFRPRGPAAEPVVPLEQGPEGLDLQDEWILALGAVYGLPLGAAVEALEEDRREAVRRLMVQAHVKAGGMDRDDLSAAPLMDRLRDRITRLTAILAAGGSPLAPAEPWRWRAEDAATAEEGLPDRPADGD